MLRLGVPDVSPKFTYFPVSLTGSPESLYIIFHFQQRGFSFRQVKKVDLVILIKVGCIEQGIKENIDISQVAMPIQFLSENFELPVLLKGLRPSSNAELFMSRTQYLELSTGNVRRLNKLRTAISIWNGSVVLPAWLSLEFQLWPERLWFGRRT